MYPTAEVSADGARLTVRVPMDIRKRGGRKVVIAPHGAVIILPRPRVDSTLVKAIARAYRWQRMLEEGTYASMRDLAAAEKISPTYISCLLRLTLLAPGLVEAALDGKLHGPVSEQLLSQQTFSTWDQQQFRGSQQVRRAVSDA
ncbi:MAG: hypothetical protein H0T56_00120 [Pseudaminobacter sp.]|nr:hypothetical protein [Pseudaminobacter sp.]